MTHWRIDPAGADALIVRFGEHIDPALADTIRLATDRLRTVASVRDLIPSYTTLMVCYSPVHSDFERMAAKVTHALEGVSAVTSDARSAGRRVEIPVWYHSSVGPDLERVARYHKISVEEVIHRHSGCDYQVFAIGFAPGFAYMGNVDPSLATPRLDTPRPLVPAGSVALADQQTAVYPISTPGGWNILGRTAVKMFDRQQHGLCPVSAGDRVRFVPVSKEEFLRAGGNVE
ncbi:5-oxoprolinase subunit PxpB [Marinimicrobium sp. ABcell2]|uniref:5-oxoprolinase subunit PxpB n=1 Tax=Marinimicrobium sp. ABcell2 TaxID=3069751 RepID=UPI0027AEB85D|nr:5-oxoprolinase subunit PxpB [Marinimicrobium sp. ABcell2]MDQ2076011.1 5-oxoprolinase subunit PxpB [Marinimicrobium sp. ABcell2]